MKKKIALIVVLVLALSCCCCACDSSEELTGDELFIQNLSKGLEARWALNNSVTDPSEYDKLVQAELDALGDYNSYEFTDSNLAEMAKQYYDALDSQLKAIGYYNTDYTKYDKLFNQEGYNVRMALIKTFSDEYDLTVSSIHQDMMDDCLKDGAAAQEILALQEEVNAILDTINFELKDSSYGWKDYSATVENTTNETFDNFWIEISLIDENGVSVDQQSCYIENWKPGDKNVIEFSTEADFTEMTFSADYY